MEQAVKQRLVGAAVLAAIALVTVPMIFDTERTAGVQVPESMPPMPVVTPIVTPEAQPVPLPADRPTPEPVPVADLYSADREPSTPITDDSPPPVQAEPQPAKPLAPAASTNAAATNKKPIPPVPAAPGGKLNAHGTPEAWVVQVAALSDQKKINALVASLKLNGHTVFTRTTTDSKGKTTRVFVGPKLDKAQALKLKQQIDAEQKLNSMVKPFSPQ
ncbi:MAG: SPOR domain-containing protein [Pseudomonadales bacterium]|nr:SPOR domain-containing protein [Pseudomonadales bacterium]